MKKYKVLGLMSGTSLDGLDLAYCGIWQDENGWQFELLNTHSISYDTKMREQLKDSILLAADELLILHNEYGNWLGQKALDFITKAGLHPDFIASHGHTTHHKPDKGLTFQIGNGQHLANASGFKTVCDFRTNDVALGGEGAPLVPIGDRLLLGKYDFCLNLGGISNVSFEKEGKRIAYDIGLANMPLNHITRKIDLDYDADGTLARKGKLNKKLFADLNELEYYRLPFPKSTGYEWFVEKVAPLIDGAKDSIENLLHTTIHHICEQIALQLKANAQKSHGTLLVTGGGGLNSFMMDTLNEKTGDTIEVVKPSQDLIEFKEAIVFALMGVLRLEGQTNVLSSVTGASRDSSSGVVYLPS